MSQQSNAQTERTVRSIAQAMRNHQHDSPTKHDLSVITGFPEAEIEKHGEAARALAARDGSRSGRSARRA